MSNLPTYSFRPKFKAGPDPCTLQSLNETRARLFTGNTFFRSIDVGKQANNIKAEVVWLKPTIGNPDPVTNPPTTNRSLWENTTDQLQVKWVEVFIRYYPTVGAPTVETYYAQQYYATAPTELNTPPLTPILGETYLVGSTPTGAWVGLEGHVVSWNGSSWDDLGYVGSCENWIPYGVGQGGKSAIGDVRTATNSSTLVTMPTRGTDTSDSGGSDGCYLNYFAETVLTGGNGAPTDPDSVYGSPSEIRTGPIRSSVYINQSERTQPNGDLVDVKQIVEWDGSTWIPFSL